MVVYQTVGYDLVLKGMSSQGTTDTEATQMHVSKHKKTARRGCTRSQLWSHKKMGVEEGRKNGSMGFGGQLLCLTL
jgi:hypothetical protein